jgi:hypothetical protein
MARFVNIDPRAQHDGLARVIRGLDAVRSLDLNINRASLRALAAVGAPVTRAAAGARALYNRWAAARLQRIQDEKLWNLALRDARIMADLSRAMSRDAAAQTRRYY